MPSPESAYRTIRVGSREVRALDLAAIVPDGNALARLPYSLRVLLENVARCGDVAEAEAVVKWEPEAEPDREMSFAPARVLLQDFTGVPCIVDLAAMRDAMAELGGDPERINPLVPVELVIDHSVQVDYHGRADALQRNVGL
ncbi:MAG: aconitate hydratase, partial [Armatimonadetes bacterium]|nr:aconitate hydratase [Armatimonadota bacterium]